MRPVNFVYFLLILPIALALPIAKEQPSVATQEATPVESRHADVPSQLQPPRTQQSQQSQETTSARINADPNATRQISKSSSSTAELSQQTSPVVQGAPEENSSETTSPPRGGSPPPQSGVLGQVVDGVSNALGDAGDELNELFNFDDNGKDRFWKCGGGGCQSGAH